MGEKEEMLDHQHNYYVFPERFRKIFKISAPFGLIGVLAFAIFMWYLSIVQTDGRSACVFVAVVFTLLAVFLAFQYKKNSSVLGMQYSISTRSFSNAMGKGTTYVSFQDGMFCTRISGEMYIYKASVKISFYVLSSVKYKEIELTDNTVKSVGEIFKAGYVIIPDTVETRKILLPYVDFADVPEYPSSVFINAG